MPKNMSRPHVALVVETSIAYGRRLLAGIANYVRVHRPWSVFLEQRELGAEPPAWLSNWRGDGVISRVVTPQLVRQLRRHKIPCVSLSDGTTEQFGLPCVQSDHRAIGRMAAEHLRERGFRQMAYCGYLAQPWSTARREGFLAGMTSRDVTGRVYESQWTGPNRSPWEREQDNMGAWLRTLPRPVGLMACNDMRGQNVLDACQRVGLAVPEDVAVIGVDDDELLCDLCQPPLSSVIPNPEQVGFEAAALLDRLMHGERADDTTRLVAPRGVATRQSTDLLAIQDGTVAAAVRYIRERACEGITVADVLAAVPASRSVLERLFRRHLGRSPQAEIRAVQIKRVRQLLAETDRSLAAISEMVGIRHPEYLSVMFKRETGQTPGEYRRRARPAPAPR